MIGNVSAINPRIIVLHIVVKFKARFDSRRCAEVQGSGKAVQGVMENERKPSQRDRDEHACVFMRRQGEGRRKSASRASQERRRGGGRRKEEG